MDITNTPTPPASSEAPDTMQQDSTSTRNAPTISSHHIGKSSPAQPAERPRNAMPPESSDNPPTIPHAADTSPSPTESDATATTAIDSSNNGKLKHRTSAKVQDAYKSRAYDRMTLQLIKGDKSRLQAAAAALDMSPTALIIAAVNAYTATETLTTKAKNPYI